jgi:hypothetical protein
LIFASGEESWVTNWPFSSDVVVSSRALRSEVATSRGTSLC